MNSIHPYLLRLLSEFQLISKWRYFEPTAAVLVFLLFFLIGRKSYESKFTQVLNTINDCQNEKTRLRDLIKKRTQSLTNLGSKMTFFQIITLLIVIGVTAFTYIKAFQPLVVGVTFLSLITMWAGILLLRKYLQVVINNTKNSLQKKQMSSESDSKEIIILLGEEVCKQLKTKFERELDIQWTAEEKKDCDLRKCYQQKTVYKQLHQLYMDIMAEMRKMQWCDICSQMLNTDANQIKLSEFETRLKGYKAVSDKLPLQKKKQLTNKLLEEWQILEGKLPFICKRGCCIRFRHALEDTKKKNHDRLKALKSRIALLR